MRGARGQVTSSFSGPQDPANVISGMHYNAFGGLTLATLGDTETETYSYVPKLTRLQSYTAKLNTTTLYNFNIGTFAPDGDILSANDSANGNWTYTYDPFNRLVGSNKNSGQSVFSYVYDRFGNRWQQNGPNSFIATFTGNNPGSPANNNRMDGYSYDAAGNLLNDGAHSYKYDAENRIIQVDAGNTATYVYDADGRRVQKTSSVGNISDPAGTWIFFYDQSGRMVQEFNSPGNTFVRGHIYAGSRHLASVGGGTIFSHSDWLGTERFRIYMANFPNLTESCSSLPFGDGLNCVGSDQDPLHFTGKERDAATGLDYFGARFDSSSFGRFMCPDPANIAGDLDESGDPQSWNAFSYVQDNPVNAVDPDGLDCVYISGDKVYYNGGDCTPGKNGTYVNGTIDPNSATYDRNTGTVGFSYANKDTGTLGKGVISNVYPSGGVSDADRLNAVTYGTQLAEKNIRVGAIFMAENALYIAGGGLLGAGLEALAAREGVAPALKVVINWAHRISEVRPGHLPPPGTQAEIQQAVEGAIKAGKYTTSPNGVISGTTEIHGVEVGFRGKQIGDEIRVRTVFEKK